MQSETRNVHLFARPARIATFIDADDPCWPSYARSIIGEYSLQWGGWGNVIIPYGMNGVNDLFTDLLRLYDPDYIHVHAKTLVDLKTCDPRGYSEALEARKRKVEENGIRWSAQEQRNFDSSLRQRLASPDLMIDQILGDKVWPFRTPTGGMVTSKRIGQTINPSHTVLIRDMSPVNMAGYRLKNIALSDLDQLLMLGIETVYGSSGNELEVLTKECSWETDTYTPSDISAAHSLLWGGEERMNGAYTGCFGVGMRGITRFVEDHYNADFIGTNPLIIVVGDQCADYCLYNILSRLTGDAVWLPKSYSELVIGHCYKDSLLGFELGTSIRKAGGRQTRLTSLSWNLNELHEFTVQWDSLYADPDCEPLVEENRPQYERASIPKAYFGYDTKKLVPHVINLVQQLGSGRTKRYYFIDGESVEDIDTPMPDIQVSNGRCIPEWVASVKVENNIVPSFSAAPDLFLSFRNPWKEPWKRYRASWTGIHYIPSREWQWGNEPWTEQVDFPFLKLPDDDAVLKSLLGSHGFAAITSDKGKYMRETIRLFGGLTPLSKVLQSQNERTLLYQIVSKKEEPLPGIFLDARRRRALVFENFADVLSEESEAKNLISNWVSSGVLRQGVIVKCEKCLCVDWYPLNSVSDSVECTRCGAPCLVNPRTMPYPENLGTRAPYISYLLAEVIYQFIVNNGQYVIVTLAKLGDKARSFLCAQELDLLPSSGPKSEVDLVALVNGALVLGEVKSGVCDKPSTKLIDDRLKLCEEVGAERFALSACEELSDEIKKYFVKATTKSGIEALLYKIDPVTLEVTSVPLEE